MRKCAPTQGSPIGSTRLDGAPARSSSAQPTHSKTEAVRRQTK